MPKRTRPTVTCPHCGAKTPDNHLQRHIDRQHKDAIALEAIADEPAAAQGLLSK